jgi:hypothetical protein
VLDTKIVGGVSAHKHCKAVSGRVEVCSNTYGNNGWLGVAQIWLSGDHITQGTVRVNDTYFNTSFYNTPAWRNLVMCQEVGHTFGLDHQDENFDNPPLGTCMDYSSDPVPNQHPNAHDYEELQIIYSHLDSVTTVSGAAVANADSTDAGWGALVDSSDDGGHEVYIRQLGNGQRILTLVTWAQ